MFRPLHCLHFTPILVLIASPLWAADCVTVLDNSCLSSATTRTTVSRPVDCQTTFDERCVPPRASTAVSKAEARVPPPPFAVSSHEQREKIRQ